MITQSDRSFCHFEIRINNQLEFSVRRPKSIQNMLPVRNFNHSFDAADQYRSHRYCSRSDPPLSEFMINSHFRFHPKIIFAEMFACVNGVQAVVCERINV